MTRAARIRAMAGSPRDGRDGIATRVLRLVDRSGGRTEEALPAAVRAMADGVRSGLNVQQAVAYAAAEAPRPLAGHLARIVRELEVGVPIAHALDDFARRVGGKSADLLAVALSAAVRAGAEVAPVLDCIVESARDGRRLRREMRAASAQGRLTALVVGGLPFAFLALMGAGARREMRFLFGEPLGWALLATGCALELAGFLWMRRLVGAL